MIKAIVHIEIILIVFRWVEKQNGGNQLLFWMNLDLNRFEWIRSGSEKGFDKNLRHQKLKQSIQRWTKCRQLFCVCGDCWSDTHTQLKIGQKRRLRHAHKDKMTNKVERTCERKAEMSENDEGIEISDGEIKRRTTSEDHPKNKLFAHQSTIDEIKDW